MKTRHLRIPFIVVAAISAVYYFSLKIAEPGGKIFDFSLIWFFFALVFLVPAFPESRPAKIIRSSLCGTKKRLFLTGTLGGIFLGLSFGMAVCVLIPIKTSEPFATGSPRYLIVLGGGIRTDGQVSTILRSRLDAAIAYHASNPETHLVVTGGKAKDTPWSESLAMARYLSAHSEGLDENAILAEDAAKDTIQNMKNTRTLILKDSSEPGKTNPSVTILTNEFHLKRALYLAAKAGFQGAHGIAVPCPLLFLPNALLREVGAWWKLGITETAYRITGRTLFAK